MLPEIEKAERELLNDLVTLCRTVIGVSLTGVYLHGSMAMGCFNRARSDIDIIVIIEDNITDKQKMRIMEQLVKLNGRAPAKGIEISFVKREYCMPFVYPTPYELHFSPTHLQWFNDSPEDYIAGMKGEDKDLAAHFTIIGRYGICLYGKAIAEVFGEIPSKDYIDSLWYDIENAAEDILDNPVYTILNLCRVTAYLREGLILSKAEGGSWGLAHLEEKYHPLIRQALNDYRSDKELPAAGMSINGISAAGISAEDKRLAKQFANAMLKEIAVKSCL